MSKIIKINTSAVLEYSAQLQDVEKRLKIIHKKMPQYIINGSLSGEINEVKVCSKVLWQIAENFEQVERQLSQALLQSADKKISVDTYITNKSKDKKEKKKEKNVFKDYYSIISKYAGARVDSCVKEMDKAKNWEEKVVSWYMWVQKDVLGDVNGVKDWVEDIYKEVNGEDLKLFPKWLDDFQENLSDGQSLITIATATAGYLENHNGMEAYKIIAKESLKTTLKKVNKYLDVARGISGIGVKSTVQGIIISALVDIPFRYGKEIEEFRKDTTGTKTAGKVFVNTFADSLVGAVASEAEPVYKVTTALAYPLFDQLCENFGYDLSGSYENLTKKTGLDALFSAQKELWVDIVYNGAKEGAAKGIDNGYDVVKKGWENWKAGMAKIF